MELFTWDKRGDKEITFKPRKSVVMYNIPKAEREKATRIRRGIEDHKGNLDFDALSEDV